MASHGPDSEATVGATALQVDDDDDDVVQEVPNGAKGDETDEDSLSRAPTIPFGVTEPPPGSGVGTVLTAALPSADLGAPAWANDDKAVSAQDRRLSLPQTALPPRREPMGSEKLRQPVRRPNATGGSDDLLAHAARAQAILSRTEESPLHQAGPSLQDREAAAAALAAAMEVDARGKMPPPTSVLGSPAKRHRQQAIHPPGLKPAPMFGAEASETEANPHRFYHGPGEQRAQGGTGGSTNLSAERAPPVHHHIGDGDPPWLAGLKQTLLGDMREMKADQKEILSNVHQQRVEFRATGERIQRVEQGQEQMHSFKEEMARRLDHLEKDLQEVRSRSVSPAPSRGQGAGPRAGTGQAPSPAPSSAGGFVVDDFQLVIGGYAEARREEIEAEVRSLFQDANAAPLLKNIITPFVRANVCRVELLYLDESLQARRRVQQAVINGLRNQLDRRQKESSIPGQENAALWVSRNRSLDERNRLRALLGLRDFLLRHSAPSDVEFDWRGRLWLRGHQVLFHCSREEPSAEALMFLSSRGDETGWWCSTHAIARLSGLSEEEVREGILGR